MRWALSTGKQPEGLVSGYLASTELPVWAKEALQVGALCTILPPLLPFLDLCICPKVYESWEVLPTLCFHILVSHLAPVQCLWLLFLGPASANK